MLKRFRSYQRGTLGLCIPTGCKVTSCQSLRMILSSGNQIQAALMWFEMGQVADFFQTSNFDSLYFWSQLTYRNLQCLFGKISTFLANLISIKRTRWIFDTCYALSKWPHLHRTYVIGGCIFFWLTLCDNIVLILWEFITNLQKFR